MSERLIGGRYRLRELVGKGGFGAVYVADQVGLDRPVALKLLHQQRMDSADRDRFEREARLAQRLEHPNTVRLLDFGCDGQDSPYIAFELLRGKSLAALLKEHGAMPARRVARITSQVLKSLMEAHGLGIVHRDIKPANLFITAHAGEPDFCKVLDFGIAKTLESQSKVLTQAGQVVGTPAYMAPEIITGRPLTPASDLYSLGHVMVQMLSGSRLVSGDLVAMMSQHSSAEPFVLPADVSQGPLAEIVKRAIAKNPAERYADAAAMLRDIEALGPALEASSLAPAAAAASTSLSATQPATQPPPPTPNPVAVAATVSATQPAPPARTGKGKRASFGGLLIGSVLAIGIAAIAAIGLAAFLLLRPDDPRPPPPRAKVESPARTLLPSPPERVVAPTAKPKPTSNATPAVQPKPGPQPCYREVTRDGMKGLEPAPCNSRKRGADYGY